MATASDPVGTADNGQFVLSNLSIADLSEKRLCLTRRRQFRKRRGGEVRLSATLVLKHRLGPVCAGLCDCILSSDFVALMSRSDFCRSARIYCCGPDDALFQTSPFTSSRRWLLQDYVRLAGLTSVNLLYCTFTRFGKSIKQIPSRGSP